MSYSVKYILTFVSQAYDHDFRVEILKKGYTGAPIIKRLGGAPQLIQDKSDGGICGTSLELLMQADTDAELEELYTTDNRNFLVLEYMNGNLIWSGYILPEIYQEAYIAAPYDIAITCSDQLGVLKNIDYAPSGRKTILNILSDCLQHTGLVLGYEIISSLRPETLAAGETFFPVVTINDLCYSEKNCYDVITEILTTINAVLTQRNNRWLIVRINDVNTQSVFYTSALVKDAIQDNLVAEIGSVANGLFPIGSLNMRKEPARKGCEFKFSFVTSKSLFLNPDTESPENWIYNDTYVNPPRKIAAVPRRDGGSSITTKLNCFEMRRYGGEQSAGYNLFQTIPVISTDDVYKFEVSYKGLSSKNVSTTVSLKIRLKVSNGTVTHYLTTDGWSNSEGFLEATGEPEVYSTTRAADKEQYDKVSVTFTGFPITGNLEVAFANNSTIAGMNDHQKPTWVTMVVSNVYLSINIPGGYESNVIACENASQDNRAIEFSFCDALALPNDWNTILNTLAIGNTYVDKWIVGNNAPDTFYLTMCKDHANSFGLVRKIFTGNISGKHLLHHIYKDAFSSTLCRLNSYTWKQLDDELTIELLEVATTNAILSEVEILTTDKKPVVISNQKQEISISHSHKNKEILDALEIDGDGDLVFNGKAVGNKDHDHAGKEVRPAILVLPKTYDAATQSGKLKPGEQAVINSADGTIDVGFLSRFKYNAETDTVEILSNFAAGKDVIAGGAGSGSSGGGVAYNRLDTWTDYAADKAGWVLSAGLGDNLNIRVKALEDRDISITAQKIISALGYTPLRPETLVDYALKTELHSHGNKSVLDTIQTDHLLTAGQRAVLAALSVVTEDGVNYLRSSLDFFGDKDVSAGGVGSGGSGGGGVAYNRLDSWADYTADKAGFILSAALGNDLNVRVEALEAGAVSLSWDNITGKPATFTPSAHNHTITQVNGLQLALDGKQPVGSYAAAAHSHTIANITGLQGALDGKQAAGSYAAASHSHSQYALSSSLNDYIPNTNAVYTNSFPYGLKTGFYRTGGGSGSGEYGYSTLIVSNFENTTGGGALSIGYSSSGLRFTGFGEGGTTDWKEVWHSGNFNPGDYFPKGGNGVAGFDSSGRYCMINNQGFVCKLTTGVMQECLWVDGSNNTQVGRVDNGGKLNLRGADFTANGSVLWTAANSNRYGVNWYANTLFCSNAENLGWYRSFGDVGWFSSTYGGGIYMTDSTWVRTYNDKQFQTPGIQLQTSALGSKAGISFYDQSYNSWEIYMASAGHAGRGTKGSLTAPLGQLVTTWAMRFVVEPHAGYGFTWETVSVQGTTPRIIAELGANGNMRLTGDLTVAGNIKAGGEITAGTASDRRLKDNVLALKNATKVLKQLRPVEFDYNDEAFRLNPNRRHCHSYSFIAQELAEIDTFKCSVNPIYDNYLGIEDKHFTPWLVAGFQETDVRVTQIESELDNLRGRVKELETMLGINEIAA